MFFPSLSFWDRCPSHLEQTTASKELLKKMAWNTSGQHNGNEIILRSDKIRWYYSGMTYQDLAIFSQSPQGTRNVDLPDIYILETPGRHKMSMKIIGKWYDDTLESLEPQPRPLEFEQAKMCWANRILVWNVLEKDSQSILKEDSLKKLSSFGSVLCFHVFPYQHTEKTWEN